MSDPPPEPRPRGDEGESVADALDLIKPEQDLEGLKALDGIRARLFGTSTNSWQVGRYLLRQRLGAGALGVVYAALDPELDREVAIKLLRDLRGHDRAREQGRLLREGQAIARLSHTNVVQVFDVGTYEGLHDLDEDETGPPSRGVFIVMERLEGQTLAHWLEARPRPWATVLERFIEAGKGLSAAHEGGVVHRDFKPANVFVERSGRVRVLDFGLARGYGGGPSSVTIQPSAEGTRERSRQEVSGSYDSLRSLTLAGTVLGTPAYMAPEQHAGNATDARSDQYSFCASLYRGLYGVLPFTSHDIDALASDKERCAVNPAPPDAIVPRWLRAVLLRGLSPEPGQRWPSMDRLLHELMPRRHRAQERMPWILGVGALALASLAWASSGDPTTACGTQGPSAHHWDLNSRDAVGQALGAIEIGRHALPRVSAGLDAYANAWDAEHEALCEAKAGAPESSDLDLRMSCLQRRATHLATLVEVLINADARVAAAASTAVASLPPLERCRDVDALRSELPPIADPANAPAAEALRVGLAEVSALVDAGQFDDALVRARERLSDAEVLGHPPLLAEAQWWTGHTLELSGDLEGGLPVLEQAVMTAAASGHDKFAALAAVELTTALGGLARYDEALEWARHAEAAALRYGRGRYPEARAYTAKGTIVRLLGRNEEAYALYLQALGVQQAADPDSHELPTILNNLGNAALAMGRNDEAHRHYAQSYERLDQLLGNDHPQTAAARMNLGIVVSELGDHEQAQEHYRAARETFARLFGPGDQRVAYCDTNLGNLLLDLGKFADAEARFTAAQEVFDAALGPDHPNTVLAHSGVALAQLRQGYPTRARAVFETALPQLHEIFGDEHPQVGVTMTLLAQALLAEGKIDAALQQVRAAKALLESIDADPSMVQEARFVLARAHWESGLRVAAWTQALEVRAWLDERGDQGAAKAEVDAWLLEHYSQAQALNLTAP